MLKVTAPTLSHFGLYVTDLEKMVRFYTEAFGLRMTDSGEGVSFPGRLVFLSATPEQHHQLVLASGRPADARFSTVMQLSFAVPDLQCMRDIRVRAQALGATDARAVSHGVSLSLYMHDPEGNTVEVYHDLPHYVSQPLAVPIDLDRPDDVLLQEAEALCRSQASFRSRAQWESEFGSGGR